MTTVGEIATFLSELAPLHLAEEWDNVGLLVGDAAEPAPRVMTCLTLTKRAVEEAVRERVNLVVAHHPLPFKPLKRVTSDTIVGQLLLKLIRGGVAVYSGHTAFDSAADGINERLAQKLGLDAIAPLKEAEPQGAIGSGRHGTFDRPGTLADCAELVKRVLGVAHLQVVGALDRHVNRIAIACGSGGSFLPDALRSGCDVLLTGETNLHTCYEAESLDVGLILAGHYATERFYSEHLAGLLAERFTGLHAWASRNERDPAVWL